MLKRANSKQIAKALKITIEKGHDIDINVALSGIIRAKGLQGAAKDTLRRCVLYHLTDER